jgi:hypothetical protein
MVEEAAEDRGRETTREVGGEALAENREGLRTRTASKRTRTASKESSNVSTAAPPPDDFSVRVHKMLGDVLGAGLGNTDKGAVIFNIQPNGLLDNWNQAASLEEKLDSGLIITEVNGTTGYWSILEELRKPGPLDMRVSRKPPKSAGPNWFEEIREMGRNLESQGGKSSFMLRLQPQDPKMKSQTFSSLPTVRARDCEVYQCTICIEDVNPDESLVQLPCGHAFHALCAARWLTQAGKHASGKRQCCPICCRKVVSTADGGISTAE